LTYFPWRLKEAPAIVAKLLGDKQQHANEIVGYLLASFGDRQRIDFGTGHEAHFAAWLYVPHFDQEEI